ncbi:MAG: hypothetical protein IJ092_08460 [Atopobiaceae bacterium]|nr:hypothetical protein [Atopobiaceae bacterium]
MRKRQRKALYNVMFPLWMLIWFPSWLWFALIPANYLIDRAVLWWSLGNVDERQTFCRKHTWKICLAGFAADFVGSLLLLGAYLLFSSFNSGWAHDIVFSLGFNPFSNVVGFLVTAVAIALSGFCIYVLDLRIIQKAGLADTQARRSAILLAILTAPHLFLFPSGLLYQ